MSQKMFLKLEGVPGESKSPRHFGEIEITGWTWGGRQSLAFGTSDGGLAKNLTNDLTVTKVSDGVSQTLMNACLTEKSFANAILTIESFSGDGNLRNFITISLRNLVITSIYSDGKGSETITFNFEKAVVGYPEKI